MISDSDSEGGSLIFICGCFRYEHSLDIPDIQYAFDASNVEAWISDPANMSALSMSPLSYYDAINVRAILLSPESRGFILLNETDPVWGPPLIFPRTFSSGWDLKIIVAGNQMTTHM